MGRSSVSLPVCYHELSWLQYRCETVAKQKALIASHKNQLADPSSSEILDKVYRYAFTLMMQTKGQRSADKDMCIEFWKLLLSSPSLNWKTANFDWLQDWLQFIINHKSVKTISRDQWNHVLKFARLSLEDESLGFHNEEQSWPSIVDEYVEQCRSKGVAPKGSTEEMEY